MLLLLLSLLGFTAHAQDAAEPSDSPTPLTAAPDPTTPPEPPVNAAERCAASASLQACLTLAANYPEQVERITHALEEHLSQSAAPHAALIDALLRLLSEQTGADGAAALGELNDPRAVEPLLHAAYNRAPAISAAAAKALAHYPEAAPQLVRWIKDAKTPPALAINLASTLGEMQRPEAARELLRALSQPKLNKSVRGAVISSIRSHYPEHAQKVANEVSSDPLPWLMLGGAHVLGLPLSAAGHFGKSDLAVLGRVAGVLGGISSAKLLSKRMHLEASEAAFISTNGVALSLAGGFLAASRYNTFNDANPSQQADMIYLGKLAGSAVSYAITIPLRSRTERSVQDVLEASAIAVATSAALDGLTYFAHPAYNGDWLTVSDNDPRLLSRGLGLIGGQLAGNLIAPRVDLQPNDRYPIALATLYGFTAASILPIPSSTIYNRDGLIQAGAAIGAIAGYALAPIVDSEVDVATGGAVGMGYGGMIGLGVGMLLDPDYQSDLIWGGGALTGETLGLAAGLWLANKNPEQLNANDIVLTSTITGWTVWQSMGWYENADSPPAEGLFVLAPSLAGAGVAAASAKLDVPLSYPLAALSMGVWGGYYAGTIANINDGDVLLAMLIGSDVGAGAGLLLALPPIDASPQVIAVADSGGILGGALAAIGTAFVSSDAKTILTGSLFGSAAGLAGGAVLGKRFESRERKHTLSALLPHRPVHLPGQWTLSPTPISGSAGVAWGATVQGLGW